MSKKLGLLGVFILTAVMAAAGAWLVIRADDRPSRPETVVVEEPAQPDEAPTATPEPEPTATPEPTPDTRAITQLVIPRLSISASIQIKGIDSQGVMQDPQGPRDVAWYNFSSRPGQEGNVVMAGHVDYINYGPAVFWRLRELREGDEIRVVMEDGESYAYQVVSSTYYQADTAPVAEIVGPTGDESVTLITCGGVFDRTVREYNQRLVIRGKRVVS
jgi:LPXTG-site transpeptidase (sortase) family protein